MQVKMPHWVTGLIGVVGVACGALAKAGTFPAYSGTLAAVAGVCALLAAPTLVSGAGK